MEQIAGFRRDVGQIARPHRNRKQHHIHRRKTGHRQTPHQPAGLDNLRLFGLAWCEGVAAITEPPKLGEDTRGLLLIFRPSYGKAAIGEVYPRIDHAWQRLHRRLDFRDARSARHAFNGEFHFRCAIVSCARVGRKIEGLAHGIIAALHGFANGTPVHHRD